MLSAAAAGAQSPSLSQLGLELSRDEASALHGASAAHRVSPNDRRPGRETTSNSGRAEGEEKKRRNE